MELMQSAVLWLGVAVAIIGGSAFVAGLFWLAAQIIWTAVRAVYSWPWLYRAIRRYSEVEPPPFSARRHRGQQAQGEGGEG